MDRAICSVIREVMGEECPDYNELRNHATVNKGRRKLSEIPGNSNKCVCACMLHIISRSGVPQPY